MKLRLHWAEQYEVVREYPPFEIDSQQFPELELEMLQVHNAGSTKDRNSALADLEHKMHNTMTDRGETIFSMVEPYHGKYDQSVVHSVGDEDAGFLQLTEDE